MAILDLDKPIAPLDKQPSPMQVRENSLRKMESLMGDIDSGRIDLNNPRPNQVKFANAVRADENNVTQLAKNLFTDEEINEMKSNPATIGDGWHISRPFQTEEELAQVGFIIGKSKLGQELSAPEKDTMRSYLKTQVENQLRPTTIGYDVAYGLSEVPAFIGEIASAAGISALIGTATAGPIGTVGGAVAGSIAKITAKSVAKKLVSKEARNLALGSAIAFAPRMLGTYRERRVMDGLGITDKGEVILKQTTESPAKSAMLAFGYNAINVGTEFAGGVIGKTVTTPLTSAAFKLIPPDAVVALRRAYQKIVPDATFSKILTATGWHGFANEMGEEALAGVLNATLGFAAQDKTQGADGQKVTFRDYLDNLVPSTDTFLTTAGIIGVMGGIAATTSLARNRLMTKGGKTESEANEILQNLTMTEQEQLVENTADKVEVKTARDELLDAIPEEHREAVSAALPDSEEDAAKLPKINNDQSGWSKFYQNWVNKFKPIDDMVVLAKKRGKNIKAGEDATNLLSTYGGVVGKVISNLAWKTSYTDSRGKIVVTGKGLRPILNDFDALMMDTEADGDTRMKDFGDYLEAMRGLEDLNDGRRITKEQAIEYTARLAEINSKYGKKMAYMKELGGDIYAYQSRILENLVRSGVMGRSTVNKIKNKNPHYVPFQRVLDEQKVPTLEGLGMFTNTRLGKVVKKLKGSEKDVKNVFESMIANTARIITLSEQAKINSSIVALSDVLPDMVQHVVAPMVKIREAKVNIAHDPKLRKKLELAIERLGGVLSRQKSVSSGKGFVLGSYSPMEKLVRTRIGTTEGTLAHEFGHMLDFVHGLKESMLKIDGVRAELQKLAEDRLFGDVSLKEGVTGDKTFFEEMQGKTSEKYMEYIKNDREILANMFEMWVTSPRLFSEVAPTAKAAFEKFIESKPELGFLREIYPSTARKMETVKQDVWAEGHQPAGTIINYNAGIKSYYKVSAPVLKAMENLRPAQMDTFTKIVLSMPTTIFRMGATVLNPDFLVRNPFRDVHGSYIQSGVKTTPVDFAKGVASSIMESDNYYKWMASGGALNQNIALDDRGLEKAFKKIIENKFQYRSLLPWNIVMSVGDVLENATRVGAFTKGGKTLTDIESAVASREGTVDFSRSGTLGKEANRFIAFFNAGVQGVDKMARAFKKNPKAVLFHCITTVTIPSMLLAGYYLYMADDDTKKEYLEIPQWQKDIFWNFKVGDEWVKVPKPFSYGFVFGSIPERIMTYAAGQGDRIAENFYHDLFAGVIGSISPIQGEGALIPPPLKAVLEWSSNYNHFLGRSIYPDWMDGALPESKKANRSTSETAKALGEMLEASPAKIDNTITTLFGGGSRYVTGTSDFILHAMDKDAVEKPSMRLSDYPVARSLISSPPEGGRSESINSFYRNYEKTNISYKFAKKAKGEERAEYVEKNRDDIAKYKGMEKYRDRLADIRKRLNAVYDDPKMTGDEKRDAIDSIESMMTDVAETANKYYNSNKGE